jgi:hypothetical protein
MKKHIIIFSLITILAISLKSNCQNSVPMLLKNGRYSYVSPNSKNILFDMQFEEAKPFDNGIAFVKYRSKWGAINNLGEYILKPKFDFITQYANGFIGATIDSRSVGDLEYPHLSDTLIHYPSKKGVRSWDFITFFSNENNLEDYAIVREKTEGQMAIFDRNLDLVTLIRPEIIGQIVGLKSLTEDNLIQVDPSSKVEPGMLLFKNISNYKEGYFRIITFGKDDSREKFTNYLNLKGELLLDENYYGVGDEGNTKKNDQNFDFNNGLALVKLGHQIPKYGYVDTLGKEVVPAIYSSLGLFSDGLAKASLNEQFQGYIDKKGIPLFPIEKGYDEMYEFNDGVAIIREDRDSQDEKINSRVVINTKGKKLFKLPSRFETREELSRFSHGILPFVVLDKVTDLYYQNVIDTTGKIIFKINYPTASVFSRDGYSLVETATSDAKYTLVEYKAGKEILLNKYDNLYFVGYDFKNQLINTLEPKEINYLDVNPDLDLFKDNLIYVRKSAFKFYVDKNGFEYIEK